MTNGVIYILKNPSFPDYIKIGYAQDLENRLKTLNNSSAIPYAFRAYATYETANKLTDKELHKIIDSLNPNLRTIENFDGKQRVREFYAMSAEDAYAILESIAKISNTTDKLKLIEPTSDDKKDEESAEIVRRSCFRFSECNIPIGAEIKFINDKTKVATVVDDRHISFEGNKTSLSALASELLGVNRPIQGTLWFEYNGKVLNDIRIELEE